MQKVIIRKKFLLKFNDPDFQKFWNQQENELIFYLKNIENNNKTSLQINTFEFNPFLPYAYQIQNIEKNEMNSRNLTDSKDRDESEINFHIRTYDYKLNNENFTNENYYFDNGNVLYRINFTAPQNEFTKYLSNVTKILDDIYFR